ncbi:hypothetical protein [Actinoplanes couchii]|uniref:Uncharacterized protein n=1 Tax=Actinoplanes couchii TaxID=403638 RepID=A0ABQ3XSW2_9ACTN|nr:hypothetical protein [Actinoplanes couchii]MDR6324036.1 hypothetical protein [Actinoplanes couchii]GID61563.1 hypothetical protein Aco03nite_099670 [Actinoplanes couchii]
MTDIAAALLTAGLPADDVAALADALRRAHEVNDEDVRGHEGDELWETAHGTPARAREHHEAAAFLRGQADQWRRLLRALEPAKGHRQMLVLPL